MPYKEYLTPSELQIEARAKAATPGPWSWEYNGICGPESLFSNKDRVVINFCCSDCLGVDNRVNEQDANFIAHSREDIPALLATLRAERAKRAELEATAAEHIISSLAALKIINGL